jgi:hypothetical protein
VSGGSRKHGAGRFAAPKIPWTVADASGIIAALRSIGIFGRAAVFFRGVDEIMLVLLPTSIGKKG